MNNLGTAEIIAIVQDLATRTHQDEKDLQEAKLRLFVTHRLVRSYIEAFPLQGSGISGTSFNRLHLVIRIGNLLVAASGQGGDMEKFLATVTKACKSQRRAVAKTQFTEALDQKTPVEVAAQVAQAIVNRVLGDGGADLVKDLFGVFSLVSTE